jgi:hypothetical protein
MEDSLKIDYFLVARMGFLPPKFARNIFGITEADRGKCRDFAAGDLVSADKVLRVQSLALLFWLSIAAIAVILFLPILLVCHAVAGTGMLHSPWLMGPIVVGAVFGFCCVEYIVASVRSTAMRDFLNSRGRRGGMTDPPSLCVPKAFDFWIAVTLAAVIISLGAARINS